MLKYIISKIIQKIQISSLKNCKINETSKIGSSNNLINLTLNSYSYIGNNSIIVNASIGSFCSIADNCIIGGGAHPINWVSTSPLFYSGNNIFKKNFSEHYFKEHEFTEIGNDVWIGNNVIIKSGLKIGDGAIIGMGSVLTKNVGEYEIWAGNPAKLIKKRFSEKQIISLTKIKWWEKNIDDIETSLGIYMNDVDQFIKKMEGE